MAQSAQPYLYAVSAPVKQGSAKYSYADLTPQSSKGNAKHPIAKRAPQPLPNQNLKVTANVLVDSNLRRPLSLNDLRPPPTSPPPPLPKSGKLCWCYMVKLVSLSTGAGYSSSRQHKGTHRQAVALLFPIMWTFLHSRFYLLYTPTGETKGMLIVI